MRNQTRHISDGNLKRSLAMKNARGFIITLIGFFCFSGITPHAFATQPDATPSTENHATEQKTVTPQQEQSRQEFKAMLWASIVILTGLFFLVFILFIFRMARAVRRLQNARENKNHTEVIDAWSNYRLPDETPQDFSD